MQARIAGKVTAVQLGVQQLFQHTLGGSATADIHQQHRAIRQARLFQICSCLLCPPAQRLPFRQLAAGRKGQQHLFGAARQGAGAQVIGFGGVSLRGIKTKIGGDLPLGQLLARQGIRQKCQRLLIHWALQQGGQKALAGYFQVKGFFFWVQQLVHLAHQIHIPRQEYKLCPRYSRALPMQPGGKANRQRAKQLCPQRSTGI